MEIYASNTIEMHCSVELFLHDRWSTDPNLANSFRFEGHELLSEVRLNPSNLLLLRIRAVTWNMLEHGNSIVSTKSVQSLNQINSNGHIRTSKRGVQLKLEVIWQLVLIKKMRCDLLKNKVSHEVDEN